MRPEPPHRLRHDSPAARGGGDGPPRDVQFRTPGPSRQPFDRMPIPIPRGEVHLREEAVGAERRIDETDALEDLRPIERGQEPHARDHVADGHVHPALPLMLLMDDLVGGRALAGEVLVQPDERRRDPRILIAQALKQAHHERRRQGHGVEAAQCLLGRAGRSTANAEQLVGQGVGLETRRSRRARAARPIAAGSRSARCAA